MSSNTRICPHCNAENTVAAWTCVSCGGKLVVKTDASGESSSAGSAQDVIRRPRSSPSVDFDFKQPGYYLDGWSDVVEGKGAEFSQVSQTVDEILHQRQMPNIKIGHQSKYLGYETRTFTVTNLRPGAATAVYIGQHGQDLYVSWKTFIKPVLDPTALGIVGTVALLLSVLVGGNLGSFPVFLMTFLFIAVIGIWLISIAGRFIKGNSTAFFFVEPSLFDADNIAAMSISVHKTILRALDKEGIDTSALRLKADFKSRRDQSV